MPTSLVVVPTGGLGNRLRALFSYLVTARAQHRTLQVYWKPDPDCVGHFLDAFCPVPDVQFLQRPPAQFDYRGGGVCPQAGPLTAHTYAQLVPQPELASRIAELASRPPYDAVHVRRTDHVALAKQVNQFTPLVVFERFISDSARAVYLACDDRATQQQLVQTYGTKVFTHAAIGASRQLRQTSLKHAVIDLWLCAGGVQFLGTPYSSFSGVIWALRTNPAR
jgi:hypothetical protein